MTDEKLLELALDARKNAYVPYSGYAVGAALLAEEPGGVRIESFSVGTCAYDAVSDCFRCTITAKTRAYLYALANEDGTEFTDFILKGEVK